MAVSRCICREILFADALVVARAFNCRTVAGLQRHCELGTGCGLCVPYMQRAIATGENDLPVLDASESAYWLERSGLVAEDGK
jgi:bacterioferritin-associated ferredoxin